MKHIPTTSTAVEKIKARARALRSNYESLGHARDAAAVEAGYDHYHHVTHCHKNSDGASKGNDAKHLLACVYRVIPALLEAAPIFDKQFKQAQANLSSSVGVDFLETQLLRVHSEGGDDYFRAATNDFLRQLQGARFVVTSDAASFAKDLSILMEIWKSLRTPTHRHLHRTLVQEGFVRVLAGYSRFASDAGNSDPGYQTTVLLSSAMVQLLQCTSPTQLERYIDHVASAELPRSMNISMHTGNEDFEFPSTYWSRISAGVSMEMAGAIATLPLDRIRASQNSLELMSLLPTVVPQDPVDCETYIQESHRRTASIFVPSE